jgi:ABC-2 type transport system permease protein
MRINRINAIVLRHVYLLKGSLSRVMPLFVWVAVDIVLWGFITRYLNSVTLPGHDFVGTLLGAILLWDFFTRVMQGVTMAFFEDVWSRNFLNVFATPITIAEYISGLLLSSIATSAVGLVVMLVLASCVFGLSFFAYGAMVIPFFLVLFLFGVALGILGCGVVLRLGPAAEWFIWPIPAIIAPFAGVFYPVSVLPHWMQAVSRLLPPSYIFEGLRAVASGKAIEGNALLISTGLTVLYIALAFAFFRSVYRHAMKSGLIARYSAETIS